MPALFALTYACVPLFPAFITLTAVTVPGVSLVPDALAWTLIGAMALVAVITTALLLQPPREAPPTLLPLVVWLGAGVLSALLGFNPRGGLLFIGIFCLGIVWHLAIMRFYRDRYVPAAIFWSYLLSGLVAAGAAIVMVLFRAPGNQYTIGHGRAIGTFILPGELAGYLILYLPTAYAVARATRIASLRALAWCGVGVGALAFVMSFSRAGWMGLAAAVAFYLYATRRTAGRYALVPVLAGVAAVLVVFNAHHNPSENYTRLSIWQSAIEIIQRFPLTGVGVFNFASAYAIVRLPDGDPTAFHAHSVLLTIFAEMGLVGVLAVIWVWWSFALALRDRLREVSPGHARLAIAVAAGLLGTWVQGMIDTVSVVIFGLWLPTMALALMLARDGLMEEQG
jgi:putative inorganic carbon (HCO3(-)) transporter